MLEEEKAEEEEAAAAAKEAAGPEDKGNPALLVGGIVVGGTVASTAFYTKNKSRGSAPGGHPSPCGPLVPHQGEPRPEEPRCRACSSHPLSRVP